LERIWAFVEKPLTQTGVAMVLAIVGTIVPSKVAMVVAGTIFLLAAQREGWFRNQIWYVTLLRVAATCIVIAFVLSAVWLAAWKLRGYPEVRQVTGPSETKDASKQSPPASAPAPQPKNSELGTKERRPSKSSPEPKSSTFSVTNPTGSIVNQDSPNYGSQVVNNYGATERTLDESQQQTIKAWLGEPVPGFQGVHCLLGDSEGGKYAAKFWQPFKDAEWNVGKIVGQDLMELPLPEGLLIAISPDDKLSPPEGALRINTALKQAGLEVKGIPINGLKSGDFYVLVGANPKRQPQQ
jgi:hypothetical protein